MTTAYDLCSLAWGDQVGYVNLSVRNPQLEREDPEYWTERTYEWPKERNRIRHALTRATKSKKDVYWSPAVYTKPKRREENVDELSMLWADLDEVDPQSLPKPLKPTAAWQSSPGRYQALWALSDAVDPDTHRELNQRLTYAIDADKGGWDIAQVLRLPGTRNHKYDDQPVVKLEWLNGRQVDPVGLLQDLPELEFTTESGNGQVTIDELPDTAALLRKLRIPGRVRSLLRARDVASGPGAKRSETLWALECSLAELGCTVSEIVALVRPTGWNKFADRRDELQRLATEAQKAINYVANKKPVREKSVTAIETEDAEEEVSGPETWRDFDRRHRPITWIVADVWGSGEVGFISGLPKSYKSWISQDLAVSISTGQRFLNTFQTQRSPVLLIQEEDPVPVLQDRLVRIAASKGLVEAHVTPAGMLSMHYELPDNLFIISNQGFTVDEDWLESLEDWIRERDIRMVILDPLMMVSGEVDEFKAFEMMNTILKPLKRLRSATQAAMCVIHHHIKGSSGASARDMYGSVALWAWEEAAMHLQITGVGRIIAERFSKHAILPPLTIDVGDVNERWNPIVRIGTHDIGVLDVLSQYPSGVSIDELTELLGMSRDQVIRLLTQMEEEGKVQKTKSTEPGRGRKKMLWTSLS